MSALLFLLDFFGGMFVLLCKMRPDTASVFHALADVRGMIRMSSSQGSSQSSAALLELKWLELLCCDTVFWSVFLPACPTRISKKGTITEAAQVHSC
jgi:hypothetical protein